METRSSKMAKAVALALASFGTGVAADAQTAPAPVPAVKAELAAPRDMVVDAAENLVGKALFLRGFYLANELAYDASGRVKGTPKVGDWTLAGVNVTKAGRRGAGEIELDGVRTATRWNPDQQQFERHPLNDEKMKLLVDAADEKGFRRAVGEIFSVGIDPALQRSMPDFWLHYFQPATQWPLDDLTGQTVYPMFGQADQAKDVSLPKAQKMVDAKYTSFAEHDKVKGTVQVRLVVDGQGGAHRVVVTRPLGYGLDARTVEAVRLWRFTPGMKDGKAVPVAVGVGQEFVVVVPPKM